MNLTLQSIFNSESTIRSILLLKDRTATLLSRLIQKFHQKYELKMGYAEFLIQKMSEPDVDPITAYGCIVSVKSFGEHITCKVMITHLRQIVTNFKALQGELALENLKLLKELSHQMLHYLDQRHTEQESAEKLR